MKRIEKKEQTTSLTIPNGLIATLLTWLDFPLNPQKSILRNRGARVFQPKFDEFEKARMALIEKYGKKGENGKTILEKRNENGVETSQYIIEDQAAFDKAFKELAETTITIDVTNDNRADLKGLKTILNNDIHIQMDMKTTDVYEMLLNVFKKI